MVNRRHIYNEDRRERERRLSFFEDAKKFKLLPQESNFETDTGHEPFVTYLMINRLMKFHDPVAKVLDEMMHEVHRRDLRMKFGFLINYRYKDFNTQPFSYQK